MMMPLAIFLFKPIRLRCVTPTCTHTAIGGSSWLVNKLLPEVSPAAIAAVSDGWNSVVVSDPLFLVRWSDP
ncbi:hypothetical protein ZHAS_00004117 [Anopheles sinensis]|uniref:Secreted protein n=1 Tax=Anopheles sinensis TaxID=74873 RepID=A0A084VG50_ANOSI|nr:hypothetical protein ZHAS_00004117 [Anopheles sinensis]